MKNFLGRLFFAVVLAPGRIKGRWQRLSNGTRTLLKWAAALTALILPLVFLAGCHPAPATIQLASTTAIRQPLEAVGTNAAAATKSNDQVLKLAQQAAQAGLKAGSTQAQALVSGAQQTTVSLANITLEYTKAMAALALKTQDDAAKQKQIDALQKHDAAETLRANAAVKARAAAETSRGHWRLAFFALFVVGVALVSLLGVQLQKALREAEELAAHLALSVGRGALHAVEKIPAVVGTVAKVGAVAAVL